MLHLENAVGYESPTIADVTRMAEENGIVLQPEHCIAISGLVRHTHPDHETHEAEDRFHILHPEYTHDTETFSLLNKFYHIVRDETERQRKSQGLPVED